MEPQDSTTPQPLCPACGGHDLQRWDKRHPYILHWVLNPGLCFCELVLGMRLPKVMLICRTCEQPLGYRSYVPCLTCHQLHCGMLWTASNAFGHWFGYVCPTCHAVIPCIWNACSLILLAVALPVWYLPARWLRPRWLRFEQRRAEAAAVVIPTTLPAPTRPPRLHWVWTGIVWGGLMWLVFSIFDINALIFGRRLHRLGSVLWSIPVWAAAGILYGLLLRWSIRRRKS